MDNNYDLYMSEILDSLKNGYKKAQPFGVTPYVNQLDLKAKSLLTQGESIEKVKKVITEGIESLLATISKKHNDDSINTDDEPSKEARRNIWASIRWCTSKYHLLFVGNERPQAKQGQNWLVKWTEPQLKVHRRKLSNDMTYRQSQLNSDIQSDNTIVNTVTTNVISLVAPYTQKSLLNEASIATVESLSNFHVLEGGEYTLEDVAIGISIAIKVTKDLEVALFLMEKFKEAVNEQEIFVYLSLEETRKYLDYIDILQSKKNTELRLALSVLIYS